MEYQIIEKGDIVVVSLSGGIDLQTSSDTRKILLEVVGRGQPVMVDLANVGYIDSSGVASLIEALHAARKGGSKLSLMSVSDNAMRVLQLARLDKVFVIHEDLEAAISAGS